MTIDRANNFIRSSVIVFVPSFADNRQVGERSSHSVLECTYQEQGECTILCYPCLDLYIGEVTHLCLAVSKLD